MTKQFVTFPFQMTVVAAQRSQEYLTWASRLVRGGERGETTGKSDHLVFQVVLGWQLPTPPVPKK